MGMLGILDQYSIPCAPDHIAYYTEENSWRLVTKPLVVEGALELSRILMIK